jgi:hypothetical protein
VLAATSSVRGKDLTPIAARLNIIQQNESNRKRSAYRAGGAAQRSLRSGRCK